MDEAPRSNRPTPRTPAAIEAELRRRIRLDLNQARSDATDGQLDDGVLAEIIAHAISAALSWHLESPQHVRGATSSSRNWRSAGGPRGGGREFGAPPDFDDQRRGPPPRGRDADFEPRRGPYRPRDAEFDQPFRDDDDFRAGPRSGPKSFKARGPRPGGPRPGGRRPPMGRGGGGGFAPRKPRRNG
jgi:hypothetical protein